MRRLSTGGAHRACFGHRVHLIFFLKFKMKHVFGIKQALKMLARSKDKLCSKLFENRHPCLANIHYYRTDFRSQTNPIFWGGERVRMDKNVCVNRSSPRRFNICLLAKIEFKTKARRPSPGLDLGRVPPQWSIRTLRHHYCATPLHSCMSPRTCCCCSSSSMSPRERRRRACLRQRRRVGVPPPSPPPPKKTSRSVAA
jgi:hypothetical protein